MTTTTVRRNPVTTTTVQIIEVPYLMGLSVPSAAESLRAVGLRLGAVTTYVSDGTLNVCDPEQFTMAPGSGDVESSTVENSDNASYAAIGSKIDLVVCP
jgi:hypothetical protein